MVAFQSHLTILASSAAKFSTSVAFRTPVLDPASNDVKEWESITYQQFKDDVDFMSRYWTRELRENAVPRGSVVGLWLSGMTYSDAVHIYGISRAGYIPQLFSLRLPNPVVVFELLTKANAKALICDPSYGHVVLDLEMPLYIALGVDQARADPMDEPVPEEPSFHDAEETVFILHTSGSTSGSPKLVPCSAKWLDANVRKSFHVGKPLNSRGCDISVWMGSMCHVGQEFMLMSSLQHGGCTIQPSTITFSQDELTDMIERCGLNRLNQFAAFLAANIRAARHDPVLLSRLQGLDEIIYSGLPLPQEEEAWAYSQGLRLKNLFGSTECGAMLLSVGVDSPEPTLFRPIPGTEYGFFPIEADDASAKPMLELVILSGSGDCPHGSLRGPDGHFHTGDLFEEVLPGCYAGRGRNDDWIKSSNGLRCDTRAIEDNVLQTCPHLVAACVVVGSGRPSPTLFVEPRVKMDHSQLKSDILHHIYPFHSRRYLHERIASPDHIVIVSPQALPRTATKGNIRRQAVEEAYSRDLDAIYSACKP